MSNSYYLTYTLEDILTTHNVDFYIYLTTQYYYTTSQFISLDDTGVKLTTNLTYLDKNHITAAPKDVAVSRQTWKKHTANYPSIIKIIDTPFAVIPRDNYDLLNSKLAARSLITRNAYWRLYGYIYFMDGYYHGQFQYSQEQIAKELVMAVKSVNSMLKELIEWGLVKRSGKFKFTGDKTFAYRHSIPAEMRAFSGVPETPEEF